MRAFVDVLNRLLSTTVTQRRLVSLEVGDVRAAISFRRAGSATDAPLKSDFGRLHLYLGQYCETVPSDGGGFQVVTVAYAYHLRAEGAEEPTFRWEYERDPIDPDARYCRHHLQGSVPLEIGGRELSMNDIHLPTGWVTVEEVSSILYRRARREALEEELARDPHDELRHVQDHLLADG